ncbi:unnamed protein product, partial [Ixodes persulcatus]
MQGTKLGQVSKTEAPFSCSLEGERAQRSSISDSLDLRSSLKSRDLIYKFEGATKITNDDVLEGDLTPKDPFRLHRVKVRLPQALVSASQYKPGSIFLGLRTENNRGKKSQVSNIAPVV